MYSQAIKSNWFLKDLTADGEKFNAHVPGDIHDSLFKAGLIPNPEFTVETKVLKLDGKWQIKATVNAQSFIRLFHNTNIYNFLYLLDISVI